MQEEANAVEATLMISHQFLGPLVWSGLIWSGLVWSGLIWSGFNNHQSPRGHYDWVVITNGWQQIWQLG